MRILNKKSIVYIILIILIILFIFTQCSSLFEDVENVPVSSIVVDEDHIDVLGLEEEIIDGFLCEGKIRENAEFSPTDTILLPIRINNIYPDSNYVFMSKNSDIMDTINGRFKQARIKWILVDEVSDTIYNITKDVVNFRFLLDAYDIDTVFTLNIIPRGTIFFQEVENNKKVTNIQGAAQDVISTSLFMRDETATTKIVAHELGHNLGLSHIFRSHVGKASDGYSCITGDFIPDTPGTTNFDTYGYTTDGDCNYYTADTTMTSAEKDVIKHNLMSYSHYNCIKYFTRGQIHIMRYNIDIHFKDMLGFSELVFIKNPKQYIFTKTD